MDDPLRMIQGGRAGDRQREAADEIPPHDLELEASVIGNALVQSNLIGDLRNLVLASDFYAEAHRRIFEVIESLAEQRLPIDVVTVGTELRARGRLGQVGGMAYLTEVLATRVWAEGHVLEHARRVCDLSVRRRLRDLGLEIRVRCTSSPESTEAIIEMASQRIGKLAGALSTVDSEYKASAIAHSLLSRMDRMSAEARSNGGRKVEGWRSWGYVQLDALTGGLHDELAIVGAPAGAGKTSFVSGVGVSVASAGASAYLFSTEMDRELITLRCVCAKMGLPVLRARIGDLTAEEWARYAEGLAWWASLPIWVDDTRQLTLREAWGKVRRAQIVSQGDKAPLGVVLVDYVQNMRPSRSGMERNVYVTENARGLADMAGELHVPTIAIAQLKRSAGPVPKITDLADSSEIEKATRTLLYIVNPSGARRQAEEASGPRDIIIAKQNTGPRGIVRLYFDGPSTAFSERPEDLERPPVRTYNCGACGSPCAEGVSCRCGRTQTPPEAGDEAERDAGFSHWVDRETGRV